MNRQTLIPLSAAGESSFDSFCVGDNAALLADLKRIVHRLRPRPVLYLWGEAGSGKTHLLNACCHLARALGQPHTYLPVHGAAPARAQLERIEARALLCVDDFQAAASGEWQAEIFGLYEKLINHGGAMVVAADQPIGAIGAIGAIDALPVGLKDLESRLVSGGVCRLAPLNEHDKLTALSARARHKGFELSDAVLRFIITYYQRDTGSLFALLERIDNASLAEQRKITVPFIKSLL